MKRWTIAENDGHGATEIVIFTPYFWRRFLANPGVEVEMRSALSLWHRRDKPADAVMAKVSTLVHIYKQS